MREIKTASNNGFSLIELMVMVLMVVVLTGLVLGTTGYMHKKAIQVKCEAQFAVMGFAIEAYKSDHGHYPRIYAGQPQPAGGSSILDVIAWKNDSLKKDGATSIARALRLGLNDYRKTYINVSMAGQSKFMVNEEGRIVQSGKAGSMPGAERLANPAGKIYNYTYPGANNVGSYDLWVGSEFGKTYSNWKR